MANEWPANDSTDWDDAISANFTTGGSHNSSTGLHGLGVLSAFKTVLVLDGVDLTTINDEDTTVITGVGFQPRQVIFFASITGTPAGSWGWDDGTTSTMMAQLNNGNANPIGATPAAALLQDGSSNQTRLIIASFSSDGFTVTWAVPFSPTTGTATIIALCLK